MANANAVTLDGVNDYGTRGADLTGNADSKLVSGLIWFKRGGGLGSSQFIFHNGGGRFIIQFRTSNVIKINGFNSAATEILDADTSAITDTISWHSLLFAYDMASASNRHTYLDDVSDLTVATYTDDTIEFTRPNHAIGANTSGSNKFNGCLSIIWLNFGQYIDFSIEANRRAFVTTDNKVPPSLANSIDGDVGGFGQPLMFFNSAFADYQNNLGSGGGFTENGEFTACTGPEIAGGGALPLPLFPVAQRRSTLLRM